MAVGRIQNVCLCGNTGKEVQSRIEQAMQKWRSLSGVSFCDNFLSTFRAPPLVPQLRVAHNMLEGAIARKNQHKETGSAHDRTCRTQSEFVQILFLSASDEIHCGRTRFFQEP